MTMQLREKKVGPYTVRELSMRDTLRLIEEYGDSKDRGAAILGAAVTNGTGQPLGLDVLELGAGVYRAIIKAHAEINSVPEDDVQGNG